MRLAVSGAGGFLGEHLVAKLSQRGLSATLIARPGSRLQATNDHSVVEMDISNPPEDAFKRLGYPDVLLHLAWGSLPNYCSNVHLERELPIHYAFLSKLVHAGLKRLVVTGTCLEYGMQYGPIEETFSSRPVTPYGFAKEALYRHLKFLQLERKFGLTWARLFYMYGDGQAQNSLFSQLKEAAERGDVLFNMSGGEQLRDYLPVELVVDHLASLVLIDKDVDIINICSGKPISIRTLVESWITQYGWLITPKLGHYPYPEYEPLAFWGSRAKLDDCLGLARS